MEQHAHFGWGTLENGWRKGPWTPQEDKLLIEHVNLHGEGRWNSVSKLTRLKRSGKSCRLRWVNYLRPDLKKGKITPQEESIILELHAKWGNRWSTIARGLPGRTDNEIKNYWRTHFKKGKPAKNVDGARARFLRQQQDNQYHHQLQQPEQHIQVDMPQQFHAGEAAMAHQDMDEVMNYMYSMSYLLHGGGVSTSMSEASSEDGAWGSLWNLDDARNGGEGAMFY